MIHHSHSGQTQTFIAAWSLSAGCFQARGHGEFCIDRWFHRDGENPRKLQRLSSEDIRIVA